MNNYKITVILTCYNFQDYLHSSINSIINQTFNFNDIELIIVDDNSTDNSKQIIKSYEEKYENIIGIYLDESHGSPGTPRNHGIDNASSEYIMFIDGDDEYDSSICELLYEVIVRENSDIVGCRFKEVYVNDNFEIQSKIDSKIINGGILGDYKNKSIITFNSKKEFINIEKMVWNKIFKKQILKSHDIKFYDIVGEDLRFSTEYLLKCDKATFFIDYFGYNHMVHGSNLSNTSLRTINGLLDLDYKIYYLFKQHDLNIDYKEYFKNSIDSIIVRLFQLKDNDYDAIYKIQKELCCFEKSISIDKIHLNSIITTTINRLILNNNLRLSSYIILLLNRVYKCDFITNGYIKLFRK